MDDEFSLALEVTEYVEIEQPGDVEGPAPAELAEIPLPEEFTFPPLQEIGFEVVQAVEINPNTGWPMYAPSGMLSWDAEAFWAYYETWLADVHANEIDPGTSADPWRIWDMDWSPV